jgi:hypothetical protein
MLYPQPAGNDRQRPPQEYFVNGGEGDLFACGLTHDHDPARSGPFVAAQLEVGAELRMSVGERRSPDAGANAAQMINHLGAGQPLDLIAQDQDVDAGENRAVSHGGVPLETGGTGKKRSIPPAGWTRNTG